MLLKLKHPLAILLLLLLSLSVITPVYAEDEDANSDFYQQIEEKYRGTTPFERIIAGFFGSLAQGLYEILGLKDPLELIFDIQPMADFRGQEHHKPRDELYLGIFGEADMGIIAYVYNDLIRYTPYIFTVILAGIGLYLLFLSTVSETRADLKLALQGVVIGLLAVAVGPSLMQTVFDIVYAGVDIIKQLVESRLAARGINASYGLIQTMLTGLLAQGVDRIAEGKIDLNRVLNSITSIGYILVIFVIFFGTAILNWQYFIRKLTIAFLIIIFPLVAMISIIPSQRKALQIWFMEFLASASLVFIHAIVYGFLLMMFTTYGSAFSVFETLVYVLGMTSVTAYARRIFGADSGGPFSNAFGLAGMATVFNLMSRFRSFNRMMPHSMSRSTSTSTSTESGTPSANDFTPLMTLKAGNRNMGYGTSHETPLASQAKIDAGNMNYNMNYEMPSTSTTSSKTTPLASNTFQASHLESPTGSTTGVNSDDAYLMSKAFQAFALEKPELERQQTNAGADNASFLTRAGRMAGNLAKVAGNMAGRTVSFAAAAGGAAIGGLAAGATLGNPLLGIQGGWNVGSRVGQSIATTGSNIYKAITDPQSMGIYTLGQFMDPKSARQIGQNIAGTPGAMIGSAIGHMANLGGHVAAKFSGRTYVNPAEEIRAQIQENYNDALAQYQEARAGVQSAYNSLRYHELMTPVSERGDEYYLKQQELGRNLEEKNRQFQISQLNLRRAEAIRANEHQYVGMKLLERQHRSRGDVNAFEWR